MFISFLPRGGIQVANYGYISFFTDKTFGFLLNLFLEKTVELATTAIFHSQKWIKCEFQGDS